MGENWMVGRSKSTKHKSARAVVVGRAAVAGTAEAVADNYGRALASPVGRAGRSSPRPTHRHTLIGPVPVSGPPNACLLAEALEFETVLPHANEHADRSHRKAHRRRPLAFLARAPQNVYDSVTWPKHRRPR